MDINHETGQIADLISYLRNKENQDLFLINSSEVGGRKRRTELHFNLRDGNQSQSIVLPDTWIPINVGIRVDSLSSFARSDSFLRLVNLEYTKAIEPDAARKILASRDARDEMKRLSAVDGSLLDDAFNVDTEGVQVVKNVRDENRTSVNPKIANIMLNATLEDAARFAALRNIQNEIKAEDLPFIMQHAKTERIKAFVNGLKPAA